MALVTVLKFTIGFAMAYVIYILFSPLLKLTGTGTTLWTSMPTSVQAFGDQIGGIWTVMIIVIAAILLLTAWREAERKAATGV